MSDQQDIDGDCNDIQTEQPSEDHEDTANNSLQISESNDDESRLSSRSTSLNRIPTQMSRAVLIRTPVSLNEFPLDGGVLITELKDEFERDRDSSDLGLHTVTETDESTLNDNYTGFDGDDGFDSELNILLDEDVEEEGDEEEEEVDDVQLVTIETVDAPPKEEDYDTDLEDSFADYHEDPAKCQYLKTCEEMGLVPISYFLRHINDRDIAMKYHGLGPEEAKAMALTLKDNLCLEKLDVSGNWIEAEGGYALARMLGENDYITDVIMVDNKLGNIGGCHMCNMLISNTGLRKISLSGNQFEDSVAGQFADVLLSNKYLRELDLSRNMFSQAAGQALGPAIGSNDTLDILDLSWNHLRQKGAIAVAAGIKENARLKVCNLAWNGFGPEGGVALAEALDNHESLLEIDITGNRLNQSTAMRVAKAITSNDVLKILKMGNNLITSAGAIALASAINKSESSELEELDLTDVPVEYEFLRIIAEIRKRKPHFKVTHGPVMRAGNTLEDLSKKGIDPFKNKEPVIVLKEHIVVNDLRLVDILKRYDPEGLLSVTPDDFVAALDELAVPYNRILVQEAVEKLAKEQSGRIYFGGFIPDDEDKRSVSFSPEKMT